MLLSKIFYVECKSEEWFIFLHWPLWVCSLRWRWCWCSLVTIYWGQLGPGLLWSCQPPCPGYCQIWPPFISILQTLSTVSTVSRCLQVSRSVTNKLLHSRPHLNSPNHNHKETPQLLCRVLFVWNIFLMIWMEWSSLESLPSPPWSLLWSPLCHLLPPPSHLPPLDNSSDLEEGSMRMFDNGGMMTRQY